MNYKLMVVDDEGFILKSIKRLLARVAEYEVECYESAETALKRAQTSIYDVIISDYRMPTMNGVEFLQQVKEIQPEAMRIILTAFTDIEVLMGAINDAAIYRFIAKPWNDADVLQTVAQAIEYRNTLNENRHLAEMVRQQQQMLTSQHSAFERLGEKHPNLVQVDRAEDGSIIIILDPNVWGAAASSGKK